MSHKHSNRTNMVQRKKRKAFSLVELVVVILIIAILAAAVFLGGATVIRQARERQVQSDLRNFGTYVQDMLYDNPGLQYHSDYVDGEHYTFDATTTKFSGTDNAATPVAFADVTDATLKANADMAVLTLLNKNYLTADFQLVETKDAWKNPYCFSYDQIPAATTGETSSCIIVINSLGQNSLDETSDAVGANAIAAKFKTDMTASSTTYTSAEQFVGTAAVKALYDAGDDYGVVIVMIDGQVSVAYYGF